MTDEEFERLLMGVAEPGEFEVWAAESAVPVARFSAGGLVSAVREMERGSSRPAARFSPGGIVGALSDVGTSFAPVIEAAKDRVERAVSRVPEQPRCCSECEDERDRDAGCVVCAAIRHPGRPARVPFYRVVGLVMGLTR